MRLTQEISVFNPRAISRTVLELNTSITQTARRIDIQATEIALVDGKVETAQADISVMAGQIESKVETSTFNSSVTQLSNQITSEVEARQNADNGLSSRINQSAHTISMSVSGTASKTTGAGITITLKDKNGNTLSTGSGTVKIDGNVIFSSQLTDGTTTISGNNITTGSISLNRINGNSGTLVIQSNRLQINSGTIGIGTADADKRWTIGGNTSRAWIYSGSKSSLTSTQKGVYVGTDGIEVRLDQGTTITNNWTRISTDGFWTTWLHLYDGSGSASAVISDESRGLDRNCPRIGFTYGIVTGGYGLASSNNLFCNYTILQGGYTEGSDRRIKSDISRLDAKQARKFIMGLLPSQYHFTNRQDTESWHHGFIAQDVEEVGWDGLVDGKGDEIKGISYSEIIADIVAVLQDLLRKEENG